MWDESEIQLWSTNLDSAEVDDWQCDADDGHGEAGEDEPKEIDGERERERERESAFGAIISSISNDESSKSSGQLEKYLPLARSVCWDQQEGIQAFLDECSQPLTDRLEENMDSYEFQELISVSEWNP